MFLPARIAHVLKSFERPCHSHFERHPGLVPQIPFGLLDGEVPVLEVRRHICHTPEGRLPVGPGVDNTEVSEGGVDRNNW